MSTREVDCDGSMLLRSFFFNKTSISGDNPKVEIGYTCISRKLLDCVATDVAGITVPCHTYISRIPDNMGLNISTTSQFSIQI